ncbi:MAG TPA: PhnD/SsuA/transferrin family substrate-binding protein, partial [Ktedonobacteraceae bacterium]
IRFATYLAPNIYDTYAYIARYVEEKIGRPTTLTVGQSFDQIADGQVDVAFMCGLPYATLAESPACPLELLAAPVLRGERYQRKPIYFSDVIVRKESPYTSFDDLRGCAWAYNQQESHSGWNIVVYSLLKRGQTPAFFGQLIATGSHQRSIAHVLNRQADAAAIDSHVLDVFLAHNPTAAAALRVIDMLGPSSIPPVVIARSVDQTLKRNIQEVFLTIHEDPQAASALRSGAFERFVKVKDDDYSDIREMRDCTQAYLAAQNLQLRPMNIYN